MFRKAALNTLGCIFITGTLILTSACGSKSSDNATQDKATLADSPVTELTPRSESIPKPGDMARLDASEIQADDLKPTDAADILAGFIKLVEKQRAAGSYRAANETMRNFIDIYDIVKANHKTDFLKAIRALNATTPGTDIEAAYASYQERLAGYDGNTTATAQRPDSAAAASDSVNTLSAPEFRPAE